MKKSLLISLLASSLVSVGLAGCGSDTPAPTPTPEPSCSHVDENPIDHKCDKCGEALTMCIDENEDGKCDVCGVDMPKPAEVVTLKKQLIKINDTKNYTIEYVKEGSTKELIPHEYFYTKNSISRYAYDNKTYSNSYYYDGVGTYQINYDVDHFVGSIYRSKLDNPWTFSNVGNLYFADKAYVYGLRDNITSVKITSKPYRLAFLKILGYEITDFVNMESLTAFLDDDDNVMFKFIYDGSTYFYKVKDFGTTVDLVVDEYVNKNKGTVYTVKDEYLILKKAFNKNNYSQGIYYFGETEEETGYIGVNYFLPSYFYAQYFGSGYMSGYISVDYKEAGEQVAYGIYQFAINKSVTPAEVQMGSQVSDTKNIPYAMNYPIYLKLWNNFQYFRYLKDTSFAIPFQVSDNAVITTESTLLEDFSYNFNMDSSFSGQRPFALTLDYTITDGSVVDVTFYYSFTYAGQLYTMPFYFFDFGVSSSPYVDQLYEMVNN